MSRMGSRSTSSWRHFGSAMPRGMRTVSIELQNGRIASVTVPANVSVELLDYDAWAVKCLCRAGRGKAHAHVTYLRREVVK